MNTIRTTLAVALLMVTVNNANAQKVEDIVKKHVEAIGGTDKWKGVNTVKYSGDFVSAEGQKVLFTYNVANATAIRKEYTYENTGASAHVIVTNTSGWAYVPQPSLRTKNEAIPPVAIERLRYSLLAQDPLVNYKSKGSKVVYTNKEKIDGNQCYRLEIAFKGDTSEYKQVMYIDTNSYYNLRTSMRNKEGEVELIHYNDYKKSDDGLLYPGMFNEGAGPQYIRKIEFNATLDPKAFDL